MWTGSLLHRDGATLEKALSPYVANLVFGTSKYPWLADLRDCLGSYATSMSVIYWGAWPCKALYVKRRTLKMILQDTGSQCNCFSTGVMCSYFRVRDTTQAALFWSFWSLQIWLSGMFASKALLLSRRDVTKAWMSVLAASWFSDFSDMSQLMI